MLVEFFKNSAWDKDGGGGKGFLKTMGGGGVEIMGMGMIPSAGYGEI